MSKARRFTRTGRHRWAIVEQRFNWRTLTGQEMIVSTHKTRVRAEAIQRAHFSHSVARVVRSSLLDDIPRLTLWWPPQAAAATDPSK